MSERGIVMRSKPIIAGWMSPARLFDFTVCNQMMNLMIILLKWVLEMVEGQPVGDSTFAISEQSYRLFNLFYSAYGIGILIVAFFLMVICVLGHISGVD